MKISRCSLWNRMGLVKTEKSCCLYALGELSREESLSLEKHLRNCRDCRGLVAEFERMILFDFPPVAVSRLNGSVPEELRSVNEDELLMKIRQRANTLHEQKSNQPELAPKTCYFPPAASGLRMWRVAGRAALAAGWLVAAAVILGHGGARRGVHRQEIAVNHQEGSGRQALKSESEKIGQQLKSADATLEVLKRKLKETSGRARTWRAELTQLKTQYRDLTGSVADLNGTLEQKESLLEKRSVELQLTRDDLNSEIVAKLSLQGQLSDVYSRFEKQRQEVTKLERIAAAAPVVYPIAQATVGEGEAREILGARDLHIFDVHDVDNSGKASQVYGRVYYVNHNQLIFYAFDLSSLEKNHRLVAFQAWGFRQPISSEVESLGLFYLDNATLNRWALRVSDPGILSRIDTLFVTVEPPGGSRFPKGRRLLMASLAGPPNHP